MCQIYQDGEQHIRAGKLNLVDLAGSERQSKTQVLFYFLIIYIYKYLFYIQQQQQQQKIH